MNLLAIAAAVYLAVGLICAARWVPWGDRTYFVSWIRPTSRTTTVVSTVVASVLAVGLVGVLWPLYGILRRQARRERERRAEQLDELAGLERRMDAAAQELDDIDRLLSE